MCGILSGTCPLFSQMAWINFNGFSRGLSGIFFQIDNFKCLEQNSEKRGIRDLFESLLFAVSGSSAIVFSTSLSLVLSFSLQKTWNRLEQCWFAISWHNEQMPLFGKLITMLLWFCFQWLTKYKYETESLQVVQLHY